MQSVNMVNDMYLFTHICDPYGKQHYHLITSVKEVMFLLQLVCVCVCVFVCLCVCHQHYAKSY